MSHEANSSFIDSHVQRTNRNLLIWNGAVLLVLVVLGCLGSWYYYNFFFGPFPMDDAGILAASQQSGFGGLIRYVALDNHPLLPTGFRQVVTVNDKAHHATPYFLTRVGDQFLLVQAQEGTDGEHLVGQLSRIPAATQEEVVNVIVQRQPALAGRILPVMLNADAAFNVAGYIGLALVMPIALLCLFNVGRALLRSILPHLHPIACDADAAEAIDDEVAAGPTESFGKVLLTRSWLLRPTMFGLVRQRLADAVWVYGVNVGGRHAAVLQRRDRKSTVAMVKPPQLAPLLQAIQRRVPWALTGYDKTRFGTWRKRPAEVIAQAEARRDEHEQRSKRPK